MPKGSCLCGNIQLEFTEYQSIYLCHCHDCRKLTSSVYAYNIMVANEHLKILQGTPKEFTKLADSGRGVTTCFCPDCGSVLYRYGDGQGGIDGTKSVRAGIVDDTGFIDKGKPSEEFFTARRLTWISEVDGAIQYAGEPE